MPGVSHGAGAPVNKDAPAAPKSSRRWLIVGVVVVVLAIVGLSAYLLWFRASPAPQVPSPQPPATPEVPPAPAPTPVLEPSPTTPAARDDDRYLAVRNIQSGLELYFAANKHYPVAALPLVLGTDTTKVLSDAGFSTAAQGTTYLGDVPHNPAPAGTDYTYESLDGTTYTISFQFEAGAAGLAAGDHKATPQGIDGLGSLSSPTAPSTTPHELQLPTSTVDTDGDGLTDAEEPLVGCDPAKADTDGDTYADGLEVEKGFDPAKAGAALLQNSASLATYTSTRFGYTVRYPAAWLAKARDAEGSEVIFSGAGAEFIEVLVVDNPEHLSAPAWYAKQVPGTPITPEQVPTFTSGTLTWALSFDGLNAYLTTDQYLITLSYNIGDSTQASFYHLFRAMASLFQPPVSAAPPVAPGSAPGGSTNTNTNAPPPPPPGS